MFVCLLGQSDPVLQQNAQVVGHGKPEPGVSRQSGPPGAKLCRVHCHLQEVPAHLSGHLQRPSHGHAQTAAQQKAEVRLEACEGKVVGQMGREGCVFGDGCVCVLGDASLHSRFMQCVSFSLCLLQLVTEFIFFRV